MRTLLPRILLTIGLALALVPVRPLAAEEKEPASASDSEPKVTKIAGVLEAVSSAEIMADAEHVDNFVIKRIVPHGSVVAKDENLVWFDREDVDKKIKDAEVALRLSRLTLDGELFDHEQFLKSQSLDREAAERNRKAAQQDHDNFVEVDRERQAKSAAFNLKSSLASLENAQEELNQLEQMYKEDDLTEESEEIVLKRAKQAVESAQFRHELMEIQSDRTLKQEIPRSTADQDAALARAELAYHKTMNDLNVARQRRDIELGQKKEKFRLEEEALAELKDERRQMVLASPMDGIALHGKLTRGRLGDKPSTFEADAKVSARQVLLTVVDPKKLRIRVDLDEAHLGVVTEGAKCKVVISAFPDLEATGTVKSVSNVPYAANKYDCVVALHAGKHPTQLIPTMGCELQFQASADEKSADEKSADEKSADEKSADEPSTKKERE